MSTLSGEDQSAVKKLIIIVLFPVSVLGVLFYSFLNQEFGYHLHYIGQKGTIKGSLSELWLESCPDIPENDAEPNSLLGAVVAGREILNTKFHYVLSTMVNCGADIEQRDSIGFTALHAAILYSDPIAVKKLLDLGASKDTKLSHDAAKKYGSINSLSFATLSKNPNQEILEYLAK